MTGDDRGADRLRACLAGGAVAAGALAFHPLVRAQEVKAIALLVVALALVTLSAPRWLQRRRVSAGAALLVATTGWLGLSLSWSSHPAPEALSPWLAASALAWSSGAEPMARGRARARIAATFLLLGSAALWLGGVSHAGHGNANWLGLSVAAALPLAIEGMITTRGRARALHAVAAAAGLGLLVPAASRAALVGLTLAGLFVLPGRTKASALLPLALGFLVAGRGAAHAAAGRLVLFGDALAAFRAPWGVGLGGFPAAFLEAQGARLSGMTPDSAAQSYVNATTAHNDLLQLGVEGGLVAAGLVSALLLACALSLRSRWPAGSAMAVVIFVSGMGDVPLTLPAVLALLALVLGASPAHATPPRIAEAPTAKARLATTWRDRLVGLALALALASSLPRLSLGFLAQRGLSRAQAEGAATVARLSDLSRIAPHDAEVSLALGVALLDAGHPGEGLTALEASKARLANLGTELSIGRAQLALGEPRAAVVAFERALAIHPGSFRAWLGLADAHRAAGAFEQAETALASARDLRPHDVRLRALTEQIRRESIEAATREVHGSTWDGLPL